MHGRFSILGIGFRWIVIGIRALRPLLYLTPTALKALRTLRVGVETGRERSEYIFSMYEDLECDDKYIHKIRRDERDEKRRVLSDWLEFFCWRLACVKPDQLELSISGSFFDVQSTQEFLDPLLYLPRLKKCSICTGLVHDKRLQLLVEHIVKKTTKRQKGYNKDMAQFPFTKLPGEIQLRILKYTDLIASDVLTWIPPMGFVPRRCETEKCEGGFYCPSAHVAYSSSYFCWQMPTALFQTNSQIRQQALSVFYSYNRFSLKLRRPWSNLDYNWLAPHNFKNHMLYLLTPFPKYCLQYLRYLEWYVDFPEIESLALGGEHHGLWLEALSLLAQHATLHQLTLVLDMTYDVDLHKHHRGLEGTKFARGYLSEDYTKQQWEHYREIVKPVAARLRGLKDFFIRLSWPVHTAKVKVRDGMEVVLEKAVMGEKYDSFERGKTLRRDRSD